jgi:hypothetical protein
MMDQPTDQPGILEQLRVVSAQVGAAAPPFDVDAGWERLRAKARGLGLLQAPDPGGEQ